MIIFSLRNADFPKIVLTGHQTLASTQNKNPNAVRSHDIREQWDLYVDQNDKSSPWPGNNLAMQAYFLHHGKRIGESIITLSPRIASNMTCWFKSFVAGQRLGQEFFARSYMRAFELAMMIGWKPDFAHSYYFLSENEADRNEYDTSDPPPHHKSLLRIGMKLYANDATQPVLDNEIKLIKLFASHISTNHYFDPLSSLYSRCLENWMAWFYISRLGVSAAEINLLEAENTLNAGMDEARTSLMLQLKTKIDRSCYPEQPKDVLMHIKGNIYFGNQDYENALSCFNEASSIRPLERYIYMIILTLQMLGRHNEAFSVVYK